MSKPVREINNFYGMLQDFATDNARLSKLKSLEDIEWDKMPAGVTSSLEHQATVLVSNHTKYEKTLLGEVEDSSISELFRDLQKHEQLQKRFFNV